MAGDWLKFEKSTLEKPEIHGMASILGIGPDAIIGKLLRVWAWFDDNTVSGNAPFVTTALVDRVACNDGFGAAMAEVGWLLISDGGGLELPEFSRHNGETAKQRALGRNRVEKHRAKVVTGNVTGNSLPEKRREEKRSSTPLYQGTAINPRCTPGDDKTPGSEFGGGAR